MQDKVNFNNIAPFYDVLCRLVFGQRIKNSQIQSLKFIPTNSNILVVGGGTGWILDEINRIYPSGLTITYVDVSSKMIELSKRRPSTLNKITFIHGSIENTVLQDQKYDVILTPFLLDVFSQETLQCVFQKIKNSLKFKGVWLYIDFYLSPQSKFWQRMMIRAMYVFFRLTCNIEANRLPSIATCFSPFKKIKEKAYCNNFITMQVFQK